MRERRQQLALLPDDPPSYGGPAAADVAPIRTQGRTEYAVRCEGPDGCGAVHRHIYPGVRCAPCGATYTVLAADAGGEDAPPPT